ncbi:MAG: DUF5716 family protein [Lachnospiraceae bacterium]|nr:DUF5716 family protein [Lachnospiraceae bacterium]
MIQATNELILGIDLNPGYTQVTYFHQSVKEPMTLGVDESAQMLPTGLCRDENGVWLLWDASGAAEEELSLMSKKQAEAGDGRKPAIWVEAGDSREPVIWAEAEEGRESEIQAETGDSREPAMPTETAADDRETTAYPQFAHVWETVMQGKPVDNGEAVLPPEELLAIYLKLCLADLSLLTSNTKLHVMVTVKTLTEPQNQVIVDALLRLGVERKRIYVQDYLSAFYYYVVNQKKELWMQDVALITYEEGDMVGYVLHIDRSTKPAIARATEIARQPVTEEVRANRSEADWRREKDRLFFELLKKVFERRTISVSYLFGDYFDKSWAVRSIQFLCSGRRAYQGMNLYSKGACYAAMERAGLLDGREILFGGGDMIERNLGMEMSIRGKESYYPLVNAGVNWYEAHHVCEFILHGEREIRLISRPMTPGEPVIHSMRLPGLPKRPDRATRLRMTVYFTSAACCHIDIEDLGFGGLYKPSPMTWSWDIRF